MSQRDPESAISTAYKLYYAVALAQLGFIGFHAYWSDVLLPSTFVDPVVVLLLGLFLQFTYSRIVAVIFAIVALGFVFSTAAEMTGHLGSFIVLRSHPAFDFPFDALALFAAFKGLQGSFGYRTLHSSTQY